MRYIRLLVGAIVVLVSVGFLYVYRDRMALLASLRLVDLIALVAATFTFFVVSGCTFGLLVSLLSIRLSVFEMIGLSFITNFGNYIGPTRPGVIAKAMYLKRRRGLPYRRFATILAAGGFLALFVSGSTGVLLLGVLWLQTGLYSGLLAGICAAFLISSAILLLAVTPLQRYTQDWPRLNEAMAGLQEMRGQPGRVLCVCLSTVLQYVLSAVILKITYHALNLELSMTAALVISVFLSVANLLTLTPNNLGVQEMLTAYLSTVTGLDFGSGLVGAGVLRAVHMMLTFAATPVFAYLLLKPAGVSLSTVLRGSAPVESPRGADEP